MSYPGALGEFNRHDDAERMLGDKGRDLSHLGPEGPERRDHVLIGQFFDAVSFRGAPERAAQAVKRQISFGENEPARLEIAQRVEHHPLGVYRTLSASLLKKCWLAHLWQ